MVDAASAKAGRFVLLRFYYILTPLFLVMELIWGIKVRVPLIMENAELRYAYYGVCFAFGVICYFRHKLTAMLAMIESAINIALLCCGFYLAVVSAYEYAAGEIREFPEALTLKGALGFVLAMTVWTIAFKRCEWVLLRGKNNITTKDSL